MSATPPAPEKTPRAKRTRAPAATSEPRRSRAASPDQTDLLGALATLIEPMATLAVAQGAPLAAVQDLVKMAFVDAARRAHPALPAHGAVSRISTVTGLHRREVARLMQLDRSALPARRSPASQVFTRWQSDPALKNRLGEPIALPRQGPAPSFEALVQAVTRDVHPRSLLDELSRLGLARLDGDTVHLVTDAVYVPEGDTARMLAYLGSNVGDHLRAAVANVVSEKPPHFEQAVSADGLSPASLAAFEQIVRTQWKALLAATAPALQQMIDADRAAGRTDDGRVRLGLYSYSERPPAAANPPDAAAAPKRPRGRPRKEKTR
ncbi:MAG: DUF6502 family protein [Burkholderiales bacterium]|nr:DUF6502 family protein [Burkholderiales bacterium]